MAKDHQEAVFQKYFIENHTKMLRNCQLLAKEFSLFPASKVITRDFRDLDLVGERGGKGKVVGKIDLIFRYKHTNYIAEIKYYPFKSGEFWDAMKVLGYVELYKFQTDNYEVKPAIIMPASKIKLEHQLVAGKLGITLFVVTKHKIGFTIKMIDDRPHWRQDL